MPQDELDRPSPIPLGMPALTPFILTVLKILHAFSPPYLKKSDGYRRYLRCHRANSVNVLAPFQVMFLLVVQ